MRKASRKRKRTTWPIDGALLGVPPLIAELTRRYHRAHLVLLGDAGASPREMRTYGVELASRGWHVVVKNKRGGWFVRLGKHAGRARAYLTWWDPPIPRLSAHEILALTRAGKINERRHKARLASRRRRCRALSEREQAAKRRI